MKILFISALLPYPLVSGGQIRIYNLLRQLSVKHEITLVSFIRSKHEKQLIRHLDFLHEVRTVYRGKRLSARYLLRFLLTSRSLLSSSYTNREMRGLLEQLTVKNKYDLAHIEPFYVYPSLPRLSKPLVVAEHNLEYEVYENFAAAGNPLLRPVLRIEAKRIKKEEYDVIARADKIIAVSPDDSVKLTGITRPDKVTVVENGVDTQYFRYNPRFAGKGGLKLLFVGNLLWLPNREAVKRIITDYYPFIQKNLPDTNLRIVGQGASGFVGRLGAGVSVVDYVRDIRTEYESSSVLFAPMQVGGGTKFKILEAMSVGLPVITSSEAIQGLRVGDSSELKVGRSREEFVEILAAYRKNPDDWKRIVKNARKLVENEYSWHTIAAKLDRVWENTV